MDFSSDSRSYVSEFFTAKRGINIRLIVVAAIFIVSVVCMFAFSTIPDPDPSEMTLDTKSGDYCQLVIADLELAATSETEGYYYILDVNGYLGIIMTKPIDLSGELLDVYNDTTDTLTVTVTGIAEDFPDQLIGFAIEDFELADEAEFYDYFGYCLLNVSRDYTNTGFEISLFIAIIALVILLIMGIVALAKISKKKSAIRRMEASGELDRVAREMRSPDSVTLENGSAKLIMTENYFISNDGNIIRLSDILWCYRQIRKINGISYNAGLVLACKNKKTYFILGAVPSKSKEATLLEVVNALHERIPDLLIGYTRENRLEYKQRLNNVGF